MLQFWLHQIDQLFGIDQLLATELSPALTISYYTENARFYRLLHSKEGAMHFPLHLDEKPSRHHHALQQQAVILHQILHQQKPQRILELGSGQGFNLHFLAKHNPSKSFTGVDFTPSNIEIATNKAQEESLSNLHFQEGHFEALPFEDNSFDLVFSIEALSHSLQMPQAVKEAARVLRKGGLLVLFDGYHPSPIPNMSKDHQIAAKLIALAFAMNTFPTYPSFTQLLAQEGFRIQQKVDYSRSMLPNLLRFQDGGKKLFRYPKLTKAIIKSHLVPESLIKHSIAGLLAPYLMEEGLLAYYKLVCQYN